MPCLHILHSYVLINYISPYIDKQNGFGLSIMYANFPVLSSPSTLRSQVSGRNWKWLGRRVPHSTPLSFLYCMMGIGDNNGGGVAPKPSQVLTKDQRVTPSLELSQLPKIGNRELRSRIRSLEENVTRGTKAWSAFPACSWPPIYRAQKSSCNRNHDYDSFCPFVKWGTRKWSLFRFPYDSNFNSW